MAAAEGLIAALAVLEVLVVVVRVPQRQPQARPILVVAVAAVVVHQRVPAVALVSS